MTRPPALSIPLGPTFQHVAEEEYAAFLERYGYSYREHLLLRRKQFVQRYPDLQNWFQLPLPERVGRLDGETRSRLSYPVFFAREALCAEGAPFRMKTDSMDYTVEERSQ